MGSNRPTRFCSACRCITSVRPAPSRPGSTTSSPLGLSIDTETHAGLLGDTDFIVLASRGGGYGPGTPREGWDHAQTWLAHALSVTGLQPQFITAELTTADANPKMTHLKSLAAESLNNALAAIDQLWTADEDAA